MAVTAIVVNFHTAGYLPPLLRDMAGHPDIESVVIVDNSGEVTPQLLTGAIDIESMASDSMSLAETRPVTGTDGEWPLTRLLSPGRNLGFAGGVNLAAEQADTPFLLLVNPDIRLLPGCVHHLVAACRQYNAVLAGPRFFWDDGRRFRLPPSQGTCAWLACAQSLSDVSLLDRTLLSFYWEIRHKRFWEAVTPFAEPFLTGACLLMDRQWACAPRGTALDDRYFLYHEDNDISARAVIEGIPPLCVPQAEAVHYYNQAPEPEAGKAALMADSHAAFQHKYYPHVHWTLEVSTPSSTEPPHGPGPFPGAEGFASAGPVASAGRFDDLGGIGTDHRFVWAPCKPAGPLHFEIGINTCFMPFVQTRITPEGQGNWPEHYTIPPEILARLAPGTYVSRLRDEIKGTIKQWTWQRSPDIDTP